MADQQRISRCPPGPGYTCREDTGWSDHLSYRTVFQDRIDPSVELALRQGADLGGEDLAILEQHQGRNAAHAELAGGLGVFVDVQFGDGNLLAIFRSEV